MLTVMKGTIWNRFDVEQCMWAKWSRLLVSCILFILMASAIMLIMCGHFLHSFTMCFG